VKLAVVMHGRGVGIDEARRLLAAAGGRLREALGRRP
jgi:N-acetylmuramic acid 6-phosphate (MurNAc-6-P) etherase